jgi:hypothetical protein
MEPIKIAKNKTERWGEKKVIDGEFDQNTSATSMKMTQQTLLYN